MVEPLLYLENSENFDEETYAPRKDQILETFDWLEYHVENLDNANELVGAEGHQVVLLYLNHSDIELVTAAYQILGVLVQNNPEAAEAVSKALPVQQLLPDLKAAEEELLQMKLIGLISGLCKVLPNSLEEFTKEGGVAALLPFVDVNKPRVCKKALFFLMYLASDSSTSPNIPADLQAPLATRTAALLPACGGDHDIANFALTLLKTLASSSPEGAALVRGLGGLPGALRGIELEFPHQEVTDAAKQLLVLAE